MKQRKQISKTHYVIFCGLVGFLIALSIHAGAEIPILNWANRGGTWNSFWWFETYRDFYIFDLWLGIFQFTLGSGLGVRYGLVRYKEKEGK